MGWVGIGFPWVLGSLWGGGHWGVSMGAGVPLGWVGVGSLWVPECTFGLEDIGVHPWVPGFCWGGWVLGTFGCWGSFWVGGHWSAPMGAGVPWGGWALGPFGLEGIGVHLWVPRPPWGGWTLGTFGCWGVPLGWRALGCTHGCHDPLGVSGRWDPHGVLSHRAGIVLGRVDLGVLGVLGSPGGALPFGAPLGAGGSL